MRPHLGTPALLVLSATLTWATRAAAQSADPVPVCIGADRVVRYTPEGHCGAGQTFYRLSQSIGGGGSRRRSSRPTWPT